MKADIVLILRGGPRKAIQDVIILENKLSQGTDFTIRQKEGFGAILNGKTSMEIKYNVPGLNENEKILTVSKDKIFKIADHGTDSIDNLTIELIKK